MRVQFSFFFPRGQVGSSVNWKEDHEETRDGKILKVHFLFVFFDLPTSDFTGRIEIEDSDDVWAVGTLM